MMNFSSKLEFELFTIRFSDHEKEEEINQVVTSFKLFQQNGFLNKNVVNNFIH